MHSLKYGYSRPNFRSGANAYLWRNPSYSGTRVEMKAHPYTDGLYNINGLLIDMHANAANFILTINLSTVLIEGGPTVINSFHYFYLSLTGIGISLIAPGTNGKHPNFTNWEFIAVCYIANSADRRISLPQSFASLHSVSYDGLINGSGIAYSANNGPEDKWIIGFGQVVLLPGMFVLANGSFNGWMGTNSNLDGTLKIVTNSSGTFLTTLKEAEGSGVSGAKREFFISKPYHHQGGIEKADVDLYVGYYGNNANLVVETNNRIEMMRITL